MIKLIVIFLLVLVAAAPTTQPTTQPSQNRLNYAINHIPARYQLDKNSLKNNIKLDETYDYLMALKPNVTQVLTLSSVGKVALMCKDEWNVWTLGVVDIVVSIRYKPADVKIARNLVVGKQIVVSGKVQYISMEVNDNFIRFNINIENASIKPFN